ncbi:MAG TPA: magnesium/cobalt transporter CorA [Thermoleophilaceae bacterium]|jgi:magnesium transporter
MAIDKAKALDHEDHEQGFTLRVPCFSALDEEHIKACLREDRFFWLDLQEPSDADIARLGELLDLHPLAMEDTRSFGQRPKLDDYGNYALLVFYGGPGGEQSDREALREVHMFVSGSYLITIHRAPLPELHGERDKLDGRAIHSEQFVIYRILDALTDSFFPSLADIDDEIDQLEDGIIAGPSDEQLERIFALKRVLVTMRKVVTPQRDLFARSIDQLADLPGLQLDERDYFRDVYDHLIRISDLIDSYRDLLSGATDLYLSTQANRQNEVMKQLTIIATIFLPLTFLTGFFGQNFAWLVRNINDAWVFWVFGIGSLVVSCAALWVYFKRKRWF